MFLTDNYITSKIQVTKKLFVEKNPSTGKNEESMGFQIEQGAFFCFF